MSILCRACGREYDATLFQFRRAIRCECGAWVELSRGHERAIQPPEDGAVPMKACYHCGEPWEERTQPGFRATCDACGVFWHCCKNCRFYEVSQPNECSVPNIELVADKDKSNFCEEFLLAERDAPKGGATGGSDEAKRRFDALFGDR